jgi:hypothetical protein
MNSSESFAWYDHDSSSWKTSQLSLLTQCSEPFLENWPKQGMTQNGRAYRQALWAPVTSASDGGALPTPRASDGERGRDRARARPDEKGRELATVLRDLLPTPRTCSAMAAPVNSAGNLEGDRFPNLETVVGRMLPTPHHPRLEGRQPAGMSERRSQRLTWPGDPPGGRLNPDWRSYVSEPCLRRGDDGLSGRVHRLKALGNAVVPQVAAIPLKRVLDLASNEH